MPPPPPASGPRARRRPSSSVALLTAFGFPSALASHLPCRHWLVDLPASFPVQAALALGLGAVVLLAARRYRLAGVWLLGLLAAAMAVVPGWHAARTVAPRDGQPFTVLAMNLARANEQNAGRALARIKEVEPDLLFLSEVTPPWLAALEPELTDYPHRHLAPDPGYFGLAMFSKRGLSATTVPLAFTWAPAVHAVIETDTGPVGVLGVHTPRPGLGDHCVERDAALAAIPATLTDLPTRRIVLGDFNATPWNSAFRELLAATGLHHAGGDTFRPTWPTQWPWPLRVPIDHVLVSGGIGVEQVTVGDSFGSDHAPLAVTLRL